MSRPVKCEACAAGKHRAYCPTFPVPCEDIIDYYDQGFADATQAAAAVAVDMATGPERTVVERAVGATIAKRIRGGGR